MFIKWLLLALRGMYNLAASGPLAQLAEQQTLNLWVPGSSPGWLTSLESPGQKPGLSAILRPVMGCSGYRPLAAVAAYAVAAIREHGPSLGREPPDTDRLLPRQSLGLAEVLLVPYVRREGGHLGQTPAH